MDGGGDEDDAASRARRGGRRLTLTSQATGLDPDVTRAALDAFVRERGETKTVPGRRALDEETRAAVARDAERRV